MYMSAFKSHLFVVAGQIDAELHFLVSVHFQHACFSLPTVRHFSLATGLHCIVKLHVKMTLSFRVLLAATFAQSFDPKCPIAKATWWMCVAAWTTSTTTGTSEKGVSCQQF